MGIEPTVDDSGRRPLVLKTRRDTSPDPLPYSIRHRPDHGSRAGKTSMPPASHPRKTLRKKLSRPSHRHQLPATSYPAETRTPPVRREPIPQVTLPHNPTAQPDGMERSWGPWEFLQRLPECIRGTEPRDSQGPQDWDNPIKPSAIKRLPVLAGTSHQSLATTDTQVRVFLLQGLHGSLGTEEAVVGVERIAGEAHRFDR